MLAGLCGLAAGTAPFSLAAPSMAEELPMPAWMVTRDYSSVTFDLVQAQIALERELIAEMMSVPRHLLTGGTESA